MANFLNKINSIDGARNLLLHIDEQILLLVEKVVQKEEFQKLLIKSEVNQLKALLIKRNKAKAIMNSALPPQLYSGVKKPALKKEVKKEAPKMEVKKEEPKKDVKKEAPKQPSLENPCKKFKLDTAEEEALQSLPEGM